MAQRKYFAVLTAHEVVRDAGGIITGLNPIAGEFRHSGSTAFGSEVAIQFLDSVEFKGPEGFSGEVFIKYKHVPKTTMKIPMRK